MGAKNSIPEGKKYTVPWHDDGPSNWNWDGRQPDLPTPLPHQQLPHTPNIFFDEEDYDPGVKDLEHHIIEELDPPVLDTREKRPSNTRVSTIKSPSKPLSQVKSTISRSLPLAARLRQKFQDPISSLVLLGDHDQTFTDMTKKTEPQNTEKLPLPQTQSDPAKNSSITDASSTVESTQNKSVKGGRLRKKPRQDYHRIETHEPSPLIPSKIKTKKIATQTTERLSFPQKRSHPAKNSSFTDASSTVESTKNKSVKERRLRKKPRQDYHRIETHEPSPLIPSKIITKKLVPQTTERLPVPQKRSHPAKNSSFTAVSSTVESTQNKSIREDRLRKKPPQDYRRIEVHEPPPLIPSKIIGPRDVITNPWLGKIKMESDYIPEVAVKDEPQCEETADDPSETFGEDLFGAMPVNMGELIVVKEEQEEPAYSPIVIMSSAQILGDQILGGTILQTSSGTLIEYDEEDLI